VPIVLKSGSLKLLEPSGSVQACNGIALPFTSKAESSCQVLVSLVCFVNTFIYQILVPCDSKFKFVLLKRSLVFTIKNFSQILVFLFVS
jgi:hypothetical protein